MGDKITWRMIFQDFKVQHPGISKGAIYRPYSQMQILIYLKSGYKCIYDYMSKRAKYTNEPW